MNTHADKTQENKSQSVSAADPQKQSSRESTFQFADNRPSAVAQRKLQEVANSSPKAMQQRFFQEMANKSPQVKHGAHLQAMVDNYSNQKTPFIQRKENKAGLINQSHSQSAAIQRMSLIVGDTSGVDKITAEDIAVTTRIAGGEIKPLTSINSDNTEIEDGEIIALIGHGEVGEIEGISADDISDYLLKIKNISKAKVIYVSSCMSAVGDKVGDKENKTTNTSTINKIVTKLRENGVTVAAIGFTGSAIHQFDEAGKLAPDVVVNPEADMELAFRTQTKIAQEEGFDIEKTGSLFGDNPTINLEFVYQDMEKSHKFYARLSKEFAELGILLPPDKSMRLINTDGSGFMLTPRQALEFLLRKS